MKETGDPCIGHVVADRYEIVAPVGPGTLGLIYQARHTSLEHTVTLELLDAALVDREAVRDRFKNTMRQLARVRHRNVIELESAGVDTDGSLYVVTKHVTAPRLHQVLEHEGRLSWARARGLVLQVAAALEAAHERSVTHGGLRPEACWVVAEASAAERLIVTDFALAEMAVEMRFASEVKGATTRLAGDPRYLALEQLATGRGSIIADVHSVGAVLYHLLTGVPPHSGVNAFQSLHRRQGREVVPPRSIVPSIPVEVEAIVMRALAVELNERHPTVRELGAALEAIPPDATVVDTTDGMDGMQPPPPPARRTPQAVLGSSDHAVHPAAIGLESPIAAAVPPSALVPARGLEDEATVMMKRRVEATAQLTPSSATPPASRVDATTVLVVDELRTAALETDGRKVVEVHATGTVRLPPSVVPRPPTRGVVGVGPPTLASSRGAEAPPPTQRLSTADVAPVVTERLPAPTVSSPSPGAPAPAVALPAPRAAPFLPSPSARTSSAPPFLSVPAAPSPSSSASAARAPSSRPWLLVIGATLLVAAVGALVGLALARATAHPAPPTDEHSPAAQRRGDPHDHSR